ncbi:MAG: excinuclease ABC subunit UvrA [Bacteroidales bacterium]|nr:excinuclease ABC subunit UvrA [Bacteroidales bacterium]
MDSIEITGAREHNLKNISLSIPRGKLVVITGLSGSGKSSLAFDTIYAEGQRRYVDTLSAYAKQFMGMLERPDVDEIKGLSPIIAIEQKTTTRNPRSTVGTITEVYDFLRLLYSRAANAYSPATGKEMVKYSDDMIVDLIVKEYEGQRLYLLSPIVRGRKGHYKELFELMLKRGYTQIRVDGTICDLNTIKPLDRYKVHFIELVVDKLVPSEEDRKRIRSSVVTALNQGKGSVALLPAEGGDVRFLSKNFICADTGISFATPAPHTFSFNSPQGACPHCSGLGRIASVDMGKIIPDENLSIAKGAIALFGTLKKNSTFDILEAIARKYEFSLHDPFKSIPDRAKTTILYGSDELFRVGTGADSQMVNFPGVLAKAELSDNDSDEILAKKDLFLDKVVCPVCNGTRLKEEALHFKIGGLNIAEVASMDIDRLYDWIVSLPDTLSEKQNRIASDILKELRDRVGFLKDVGLNYLSLNRETASLSGGESQRIRLATQIGSKLVNVIYILDEPSIGLHQRDNRKLIHSLRSLRDEGNSVIVVEHDEEMMRSADWLVDLGPGAGENGGKLLYNGTPKKLLESRKRIDSDTADYLLGLKKIEVPATRRAGNGKKIVLKGAHGNNLKHIDLELPLGLFVGVSGVSGSGKSSLINETLMPILSNRFYRSKYRILPYDSIEGLSNLDKVIEVDQSPIGKTSRSNPATYTNVFSQIRDLFAETPDAKIRGFKAGTFSFNVKGGRCESCKGAGIQEIEMNFLPSAYVTCKECGGKRYKPDTLAVHYKGKSISDVLDMTISAAAEFFQSNPYIYPRLKTLVDVGLGYVKLGQPSSTLSGGESQRIKLAAELAKRETGNTLYILDEPTTGLHFEDVKVLLGVLQKLVDQGNTVVIIEHNLDVLKSVDYLIDLGPEGGEGGGYIVATGTPEEVSRNEKSYTGKYLKEIL